MPSVKIPLKVLIRVLQAGASRLEHLKPPRVVGVQLGPEISFAGRTDYLYNRAVMTSTNYINKSLCTKNVLDWLAHHLPQSLLLFFSPKYHVDTLPCQRPHLAF